MVLASVAAAKTPNATSGKMMFNSTWPGRLVVQFRNPTGMPSSPINASETMPSVFYAMGHYRNGVLLAPLTAALMADLVLEDKERAELALVRPGRLANA